MPEMIVASLGAAEQKAARKLGVEPHLVVFASYARWGSSLTEVRDPRLGNEGGEGELRTRRGHITRSLLSELEHMLNDRDVRTRPKRQPRKKQGKRGEQVSRHHAVREALLDIQGVGPAYEKQRDYTAPGTKSEAAAEKKRLELRARNGARLTSASDSRTPVGVLAQQWFDTQMASSTWGGDISDFYRWTLRHIRLEAHGLENITCEHIPQIWDNIWDAERPPDRFAGQRAFFLAGPPGLEPSNFCPWFRTASPGLHKDDEVTRSGPLTCGVVKARLASNWRQHWRAHIDDVNYGT
jgi:hypothetical protein